MEERNSTNLNREDSISDEKLIDSRDTIFRTDSVDRADQENYQRRVYDKADESLVSRFAKVAGIGIAGYAAFRGIVPRDLWIDTANKLGLAGRKVYSRILDGRDSAIARALGAGANPRRSLGSNSRLTDTILREIDPFITDLNDNMIYGRAQDRARAETRRILEDRFRARSINGSSYRHTTVGDIVKMSQVNNRNVNNVLNQESLSALNRARSWFNGESWFDELAIDTHLLTHNNGSTADIRLFNTGNIWKGLKNTLNHPFPFTKFSPYSVVRPFVDLFSQGPMLARVGNNLTVAQGVNTPGQGINYLIGNKIFNFHANLSGPIATNKVFTAQSFDALGVANAARLGLLPSQRVATSTGFWDRFQDFLGIGTKFRTEPQIASRIIDAAARHEDVSRNINGFGSYQHIRAKNLGFMDRLKRQLSLGRYNPDEVVSNPHYGTSYHNMPFTERLKHLFGFGHLGEFSTPKRSGIFGSKTVSNEAVTGTRKLRPGEISPSGSSSVPIENYIVENTLSNKLNLLLHHSTVRLNNLIGATTGLGFRPGKGSFGWINNAVKIGLIGLTLNPIDGLLVDAASYVNYLFRRATSLMGIAPWDGFGPIDAGLGAYKYGTGAIAGIKDVSGITGTSKYLENLMPGIINSPLSGLARTAAMIGLGTIRGGPKGAMIGLGAAIASGSVSDIFGTGGLMGANTTMSSSELMDYYSGDKKVPIKSGRWWGLGRSSFYGEGVERFSPHWLKLAQSDWQYTSTLYGSQAEYFKKQSLLPTPHNLFLLSRDKNYFAEKHLSNRPYPYDSSGNLMHDDIGISGPPSLPKGITASDIQALGYTPSVPALSEPQVESSSSIKFKKTMDDMSEYLGIYKFLGENIFGKMETGPLYQSASNITDNRRLYWDKDVGGSFGMTELLRRYMPAPNSIGASEYINNIPNQMPTWLPGSRSMFQDDKSYYKDFTIGDPYSKLKGGDYRLPGAAYEAVNKLHSGQKGVYDEVDAFRILADVAPYSKAFKVISSQVTRSDYGSEWNEIIQDTLNQKQQIMKGYALDFRERRFTGSKDSLAAINASIHHNATERMIGSAWESLTLDAVPEISRMIPFGGIVSNKLFANHTAQDDYLYRQVYGAKFSDWSSPYESFVKPKFTTLYNENPLTSSLGGAAAGFVLGSSPLGQVGMAALGGGAMGALSTSRMLMNNRLEGGYIPQKRRDEEKLIEYFDKLEFMRYEKAKQMAHGIGRNDMAKRFSKLQNTRTMVGLNTSSYSMGMGAIPKPERFYVESFMNAGKSEREAITDMTPSYMDDIYMRYWGDASRNASPGEITNSYFSKNTLPEDNWEGWNPGIQKWQIMSRVSDTPGNSIALDLHRQHISTAMQLQARDQYPDLGIDIGDIETDNRTWLSTTKEKIRIDSRNRSLGYRSRVNAYTQPGRDSQPNYRSRVSVSRQTQYSDQGYR